MDETIPPPWNSIDYLQRGSPAQQRAYHVLQGLGVFQLLAEHTPTLAGTYPLDLATESSDLDILCCAQDLDAFAARVELLYGGESPVNLKRALKPGGPTVIASFTRQGLKIELYAQSLAVTHQRAYRHMLVESRLLEIGGEPTRQAVLALKLAGVKTEPAFCQVFGLDGEPYETLLALYELDTPALRRLAARRLRD